MPALGFQFDARQVAPMEPGGAIWEGIVPMRIDSSQVMDTASKDGSKFLAITVTAMAGHYSGQTNLIRLNLWNRNPKASEIAQREMSSICHCAGRMQITDSDQLNGAMLLGIWAKETRKVTDQTTGQERELESCQVKDYRMADGRTIKEAMSGQPASQPYSPTQGGMAPGTQATASAAPPAGGAPGFTPGGAPPTGFAPSAGNAPGFAPAPHGGTAGMAPGAMQTAASPSNGAAFQPPAGGAPGAQGFGGNPGGSPGYQPGVDRNAPGPQGGGFAPAGAPGGFAPAGAPQGAPQAQPGGFQPQAGPPASYGQAQPGGFQPQPGQAGPWGQGG